MTDQPSPNSGTGNHRLVGLRFINKHCLSPLLATIVGHFTSAVVCKSPTTSSWAIRLILSAAPEAPTNEGCSARMHA